MVDNTSTHNHTIGKSIQQLHETTPQHQTAINTIQATIAYHQTILNTQQKDIADIKTTIVDIRTSINHIIHSLYNITTKLNLQITLPPPLPLSPAPPTPLYAAAAGSTTPASPLPKPLVPSTTLVVAAPPLHLPSLSNPPHPNSLASLTTAPSPIKQYDSTHQILKSFSDSHIEFLVGIPDSVTTIHSFLPSLPFAIDLIAAPLIFIARTKLNMRSKGLYRKGYIIFLIGLDENKPVIFDPGGKMEFESLFVVRFMNGDMQLDHNLSFITSTPLPPTYDLEDNVDFEGMIMIQLVQFTSCNHAPNALESQPDSWTDERTTTNVYNLNNDAQTSTKG